MADTMQPTHDAVVSEKANLSENEMSKENGQVTLASFAHLDEKKILRKVRFFFFFSPLLVATSIFARC